MEKRHKTKLQTYKGAGAKLVDLLGETLLPQVWKIKDAFSILYSSAKNNAFQEFLEGIAIDFLMNDLTGDDIEQLSTQISRNGANQFLTNILDSVFFSKCKLCRCILGIIAGKFLTTNQVDYEDLTLTLALKDLFDDDLNEFKLLYNRQPAKTNVDNSTIFMGSYTDTQRIIVEKLQNSGILGRDLAPNRLMGSSGILPLRYSLTVVSNRLYSYIEIFKSEHQ